MDKIKNGEVQSSYSELQIDSIDRDDSDESVLATLRGRFSVANQSTRNGRTYTDELLKNIVTSEATRDQLASKTMFGELSHPPRDVEFLLEVQMNNVSHNITQVDYNDETGEITGTIDILDTPSGNIVNTMVKYGSKLGISSRGVVVGDSYDGVLTPDNYHFITWDLVAFPGVVGARLDVVSESMIPQFVTEIRTKSSESLGASIREAVSMKDLDALKVFRSCVESTNLSNKEELSKLINDELEDEVEEVTAEDVREELEANPEVTEDTIEGDEKEDVIIEDEDFEVALDKIIDHIEEDEDPKAVIEDTSETTQVTDIEGPVGSINTFANDDLKLLVEDALASTEEGDTTEVEVRLTVEQLAVLSEVLNEQVEYEEELEEFSDDVDELQEENEVAEDVNSEIDELKDLIQEVVDKTDDKIEMLTESNKMLESELRDSQELAGRYQGRMKVMKESFNNQLSTKDQTIRGLALSKRELMISLNESVETAKVESSHTDLRIQLEKLQLEKEKLVAANESVQTELDRLTQKTSNPDKKKQTRFQRMANESGMIASFEPSDQVRRSTEDSDDSMTKVVTATRSRRRS